MILIKLIEMVGKPFWIVEQLLFISIKNCLMLSLSKFQGFVGKKEEIVRMWIGIRSVIIGIRLNLKILWILVRVFL